MSYNWLAVSIQLLRCFFIFIVVFMEQEQNFVTSALLPVPLSFSDLFFFFGMNFIM